MLGDGRYRNVHLVLRHRQPGVAERTCSASIPVADTTRRMSHVYSLERELLTSTSVDVIHGLAQCHPTLRADWVVGIRIAPLRVA
jgi:hypothetical protein